MNEGTTVEWELGSQRHLALALDRVYAAIAPDTTATDPTRRTAAPDSPSPIDLLVDAFVLSPFERDVVLACAGFEVDGRFTTLAPALTFGLAFDRLDDAHWTALAPDAPLRYWRLIEMFDGPSLVASPLRIEEDVLSFLLGVTPRGSAHEVIRVAAAPPAIARSHVVTADRLARAWQASLDAGDAMPAVELHGGDAESRSAVAFAAAQALGLALDVVDVRDLPAPVAECEQMLRRWSRNGVLGGRALLIDAGDAEDPADRDRLRRAVRAVPVAVFVSGESARLADDERRVLRVAVERPDEGERVAMWTVALVPLCERLDRADATALERAVPALAQDFRLGARAVHTIAGIVTGIAAPPDADAPPDAADVMRLLRTSCREHIRRSLDGLAERVAVPAEPPLVVTGRQREALDEIALHIRHTFQVNTTWGLAEHGSRGLGVSALFSGPSGTGKTLAAELLAYRVDLDLYRIDLSGVVSKYIGETEKNLRAIFEAAEQGGVMLLFDEADALFGKRSEVKDSHDRYANVEVSYLLQRLEQTTVPVVLTTNLQDAIDPAFRRRLRFVVEFGFPDREVRAEIWRTVFPPRTPTRDLDAERLARLAVTGGAIRNIAVRAAFFAAGDGEPVQMHHVRAAAVREYRKLDRDLPAADVRDWA